MSEPRARYGWESDFPAFRDAEPARVREALRAFVIDASPEQERAWRDALPPLQREVDEVLVRDALARSYSAILEYELPMEARRPDVLLLVGAGVLVVELKGKVEPSQADLDQVAAYARDLRCYHRECAEREVVPVLVPTRARGYLGDEAGVHVAGPDALDALVDELAARRGSAPPIDRARFLEESAYRPLPTLVQAARELIVHRRVRVVERAAAATEPAVEEISRIVHQAALTRSRHLILVTGVPGAGKTLVGLRAVHAPYLDDLAVRRADGEKPTVPAVFLSGNGPLVEVLQYELREAGGGGKTFVRGAKDYVKRYAGKPHLAPAEHVLVFDEAQRAFDVEKMRDMHGHADARSEPDLFVEFSARTPEWSVVVGLIGSGQEIHVGEEGGLGQWRAAVERAGQGDWTVHAPPAVAGVFAGSAVPLEVRDTLNLDREIRFHLAEDLHRWVAGLLAARPAEELAALAEGLERAGLHLRLTRSLDVAKRYLRERYATDPKARFGLLASSKDRDLVGFGVANDFQATKRVRFGPWYASDEDDYAGESCRRLEACVTEFGSQGLELDATLLAWGTDLVVQDGRWSNANARGYKRGAKVHDPYQLRVNAYRVLLTRGRDACVVFVPPMPGLDETFAYLHAAGCRPLSHVA
jgi:hypothetical protein